LNLQGYSKIKEVKSSNSLKEMEELKEDGWELIETYVSISTTEMMVYVMGLSYETESKKKDELFIELITEFASRENMFDYYFSKIDGKREDIFASYELAKSNDFFENDEDLQELNATNKKELLKIFKDLDKALYYVDTGNKERVSVGKKI
jgi:hypothetical protein